MKILYILQEPGFFSGRTHGLGGHIAHIIGVVEAFQRLKHEVTLLSFDRLPGWENPAVRYLRLRRPLFDIPHLTGPIRHSAVTSQIISAAQREQADMLYVRWAANMFFDRVRRALPALPIVMECNTPAEMWLMEKRTPNVLRKWMARRTDRNCVRAATLISAVSEEVKQFLLAHHPQLDPARIVVSPNGVDTRLFRPMPSDVRARYRIPKEAIVIGFAGNFRYWHRVDLLIRAFQRMAPKHGYLLLMGMGDAHLERELRGLAAEAMSDRIIFTGPVPFPEMPKYLAACDILVSPQSSTVGSMFHGSPIKLFEYMAMKRAVVASRIGQIGQVIEDGRNGLLFEPDSQEDLERALSRAIFDEALRERLARAARCDAESKHSWDANVARVLEALKELQATRASKLPQADAERLPANHRQRIENLYREVRFPEAIDWWAAHYSKDRLDVAISNARHLDPTRQAIEDDVWRRIVPRGGRVLDLGCGRGFFMRRLCEALHGDVKVVGLELSRTILAIAAREQPEKPFLLGRGEALPFRSESFDAVLLISVLEHVENPLPLIIEIERVLKRGGHLYICIHKPSVDPLLLPNLAWKAAGLFLCRFKPPLRPEGTLGELRRELMNRLSACGYELVESRTLMTQLEWPLYKKLMPSMLPFLIRFASWLNRLPMSYYKNLEYWLLRKP